ncbi:hypothetical protein Pint_06886 [Pistacia integerrima]|uniref:Uncharacterized protein n=1 Tax=Pistacia integerrima TaxID=434235 RepID=A0ACC0XS64_9ROSI|nr:hypothetical protein Pint_06886 [Pistacia integerrima]
MWFNSVQSKEPYQLRVGLSLATCTTIVLSERTVGDKLEEGEDDVKTSYPLCPGRHTCYSG